MDSLAKVYGWFAAIVAGSAVRGLAVVAPRPHRRGVIVVRARGGRSGSKSFEAYPVSFGTG